MGFLLPSARAQINRLMDTVPFHRCYSTCCVGSASNNNVYLLMRQVLDDKKMMNRGLSVLCIFQVANSASEEALINFDDASLG